MSAASPRRIAFAGLGLVLAAVVVVVLVVSDPLGSTTPSGVADNTTPTSLVTVTRRALSSQTQVNATLGYAGAANIRIPVGTPPSAVQQAQQAVRASDGMLREAQASLAADGATPATARARAGAEQGAGADAAKLSSDRAAMSAAQAALASAEAAFAAARGSAVDYGQSSMFTMLPIVGRVIARGQSLFAIGGQPTVLLYGSVVPSRAFLAGMSPGSDVAALNANLDALGYASALSSSDSFSPATEAAVRAFQAAHGMAVTGELPLGAVVFKRGPVRVTSVTPEVGAGVAPGPVLGITSTVPQVSIALSAAQQSSVKVGDRVSIALPDNQTTPGVVSSVGTVAKSPLNKGGGGGGGGESGEEGGPTIEVDVTLSDPNATGHLDEAPVTVSITTASAENALVVPIDALLALAGGGSNGAAGYALEVAAGGTHHLEAVTLGLFDDAEGLVQVSGPSVSAGQRVVVPAP